MIDNLIDKLITSAIDGVSRYHARVPPFASPAIKQIEALRQLRGNRSRDISIISTVEATANQAAHMQKRLGELVEIWERHVPAEIANQTILIGIRAGILNVAVASSSAAFELDRLLRGGLLNALRQSYRGTLARVKWKIASEPGEPKARSRGANAKPTVSAAYRKKARS